MSDEPRTGRFKIAEVPLDLPGPRKELRMDGDEAEVYQDFAPPLLECDPGDLDEIRARFAAAGNHGPITVVGGVEMTVTPARRVQIVVLRNDGTWRYYPVPDTQGWKIDPTNRMLIIGKGMGRIYVPLETIDHFSPEEY